MALTTTPEIMLNSAQSLVCDQHQIGGKALGLARLDQLLADGTVIVPAFRVLRSAAFQTHISRPDVRATLGEVLLDLSALESGWPGSPGSPDAAQLIEECSKRLVASITSADVAPEVVAGVAEALGELGPGPWSVRSSMVGEDSAKHSFAGQLDSFLFLPDADAVIEAIRRCWASAFGERALAYGLRAGVSPSAVRMGVVIQRMVDADASGVLFTANPVNGARDEMLITAAWGQGEGVVSGMCDTDTYVFVEGEGERRCTVVDKELQVRRDPSGTGTATAPVDGDRRMERSLSPDQVGRLGRVGSQLAAKLGAPQDVEFSVADGQLYLLQTRPITALPEPELACDDGGGPPIVWDNSNIQESYCGVTTPLTFSFASHAYATVYETFFRVAGTPERVIRANRDLLPQLLGLLEGRVYYNLNNWYVGCLLLPSAQRTKEDMEAMMGVEEPVEFVVDRQATLGSRLAATSAMAPVVARLLPQMLTIDRRIEQFKAHFNRTTDAIDRSELGSMSFSSLMALVRHLDHELMERWDVPILNDVRVSRASGSLRRTVAAALALEPRDPEVRRLCSDLLCGIDDVASIEPTRQLMRMAAVARSTPGVADTLRRASTVSGDALTVLREEHPTFAARIDEYIHRYGDRVMGELKLETVSLRQDPEYVIDLLRNYIDRPDLDAEALTNHDHAYYDAAFERVCSHLTARQRKSFASKAKAAREAVKAREDLRFYRTRMFGLYRDIYLAVGRALHEVGRLDRPRDVFWLTTEELVAYNEGRSVTKNLGAIARLRAEEFQQFEDVEVPHRVETRGPIYHGIMLARKDPDPATLGAAVLTGTGCHPGIVESAVRIVNSSRDRLSLDGQILVAVRTDPGWTPIFPTCGGILVERGSTLSHSAVVARELGIPAIVGIPHLTRTLTEGELVRMDGATGTVHRLVGTDGLVGPEVPTEGRVPGGSVELPRGSAEPPMDEPGSTG